MTTKSRPLDKIDIAILDALQENGRISNVRLAEKVNLSASPCLERVRRLETEGFIQGYQARLDPKMLNFGLTAFVEVTLDRSTSDVFNIFAKRVSEIPQIAEADMVAGGFDYLLKIRIKDMAEYRSVLGEIVDIPGVAQNHTYVVIEKVKKDKGLPLSKDEY